MSNDSSKEQPKSIFGAASGGSLFGGGGGGSGGSNNGSPFSFNKPAAGPGLSFGGNTASSTTSGSSSPSLFGGAGAKASTGATQSPFGGATTGNSSNLFGGAATPAAKTGLFNTGGSTTPAGNPPSGGGFLFGAKPTEAASSPFSLGAGANSSKPLFGTTPGGAAPSTTNTATPASSAPSQPQTSSLFGGATPAAQSKDASKPSLFSMNQPASNSASTGNKPAFSFPSSSTAQPAGSSSSPFSLGQKAPSSQPSSSQAPATTSSDQPSSLFRKDGADSPASSNPNIFGGASNTPASTAGGSSATPGTTAFGNAFGKTPASTSVGQTGSSATTTAPTTSTAPSGGFSLGAAPAQSSGTAQSTTTATSAPTFSLGGGTKTSSVPTFSLGGAGTTSSSGQNASTTTATAGPSTSATSGLPAAAPSTNLGASTIGNPPSSQSRLKNKSMDEIITRWATDLSKYQKRFQSQAKQVAEWDRMLVENSDKIAKLYTKAFQAGKDTGEVERQLTAVENDQAELSRWLDSYEKDVDEMMEKMVTGTGSDGLQGPDQERERTYKLAEKLCDRLNDLNKDLSYMIDEINGVSATLSKTDKPDDPLTQVVRVLNSHLSQLQAIDTGAAELHAKVLAAQKETQTYRLSGQASLGSDPADDFARSFLGRR
ncbi:Nsp1-like C-terminal region-domain-containing protein [Phyllosticta citribraziliensis]|uniref:Nsp1-like C-terminal region-domain-containing protein n=1 Tax=Phyllosticta citribraziliensis TaxID=989973 RepID=A0ABR1M1Q9_9PEZI